MQVLEDTFRNCCGDGRALRSEAEYVRFKTAAQHSGIVQELHEIVWLDELWQEASRAAAWHHGRGGGDGGSPELTFDTFQKRIRKDFGGFLPGATEHTNGLRAMDAEVAAFTEQVKAWDVSSLSETETKQLIGVFQGLESAFTEQSARTEALLSKQQMLMTAEQTRRLVHQRLALEHVANPAGANPYIWQRSNKSVIEQQVSRRRVRNVRGGGAGAPPPPDAFGLGAGFPCRKLAGTRGVGSRKTAGKSSAGAVDVDILAVRVPKRAPTVAAARAAERAWKIYDAHRQLSLSAYVPHTYGFHDAGSDGTEGSGDGSLAAVDIYYEHTPSRSLARCFAEFSSSSFADEYSSSSSSSSSFFQFGEQHVLFQHWVRESIRALLDLQRMSAYELRSPLTWHNLLVGNQGTSLRLGALPWGDRIDGSSGRPIAAAVTERNDLLLASFADIVEELLLRTTPSGRDPPPLALAGGNGRGGEEVAGGGGNNKCYRESDAAGGIFVRPGERFSVVLAKPAGGSASAWRFPEIVAGAGAGAERAHARASPPVEIDVAALGSNGAAAYDSGNASAAVVPEDAAGGTFTVALSASKLGRAELRFYCYAPSSVPGDERPSGATPALVVPVLVGVAPPSPPLAAMIRCCRGAGGLPVSVEALASHEMFQVGDVPVDAVMAEFSAMAEAQRQLRHSRHRDDHDEYD